MGIRETVCYRDILRRHGLDRVYPVDWLSRIDTDPLRISFVRFGKGFCFGF